jgi:hypothetical protein
MDQCTLGAFGQGRRKMTAAVETGKRTQWLSDDAAHATPLDRLARPVDQAIADFAALEGRTPSCRSGAKIAPDVQQIAGWNSSFDGANGPARDAPRREG